MRESRETLRTATDRLGKRLGLEIVRVEKNFGGGNSGSYTLHAGDRLLVFKQFSGGRYDRFSRLTRELNFLHWTERRGIGFLPRMLDYSYQGNWIVTSHIPGMRIGRPEDWHFEAAGSFVAKLRLNQQSNWVFPLRARDSLRDAKSMKNDLLRRIRQLASRFSGTPQVHGWNSSVLDRLNHYALFQIDHDLEVLSRLLRDLEEKSSAPSIISPSDFGFHNFLEVLEGGRQEVWFIDFEYAGIDHPLKLVMDFFCNPNVNISPPRREIFLSALQDVLPIAVEDISAPIWRLFAMKWLLIISKREDSESPATSSPCNEHANERAYIDRFSDFFS